jgi:hypothetical protein
MRRVVGVLCALIAGVVTLQAQPGRPPFAIYGWIDSPSPYMTQHYGPNFTIMGWTFDCRSGQQPPLVAVLDHEFSTHIVKWITQYTVNRAIARPDVQTAYGGACPNVSTLTGYGVTINEPLSSGLHFLTVFWTTGDGLARSNGVGVEVP